MPCLLAIVHLWLVFEDDDLLSLALAEDLGDDLRPLDGGCAYGHPLPVGDQQNPIQLDSAPFLCGKALHIDSLTGRDLILLSSCLNDGVNPLPL